MSIFVFLHYFCTNNYQKINSQFEQTTMIFQKVLSICTGNRLQILFSIIQNVFQKLMKKWSTWYVRLLYGLHFGLKCTILYLYQCQLILVNLIRLSTFSHHPRISEILNLWQILPSVALSHWAPSNAQKYT